MKIEDITPGFWYIKDEDGINIARVVLEEYYSREGVQLYGYTPGNELSFRVDEWLDDFIGPVPEMEKTQ